MGTDTVFKALADPGRRRLLDKLHERPGQTLGELCADLEIQRQTVSQHLSQLERAGLVTHVRVGRRKLHYLNPVPIQQVERRWIWKFEESRLTALDEIKQRAEEYAMERVTSPDFVPPDYVYTTYICASSEDVWRALTDAELSAQFWGHSQISNWNVGSKVDHVRTDGSGTSDACGRVTESDRPRRLAFTFDVPDRFDDPTYEPSVIAFEIEPGVDIVKLTVTQTLLPDEEAVQDAAQAWPAVLANLKTLLETGEPLPQEPWEFHNQKRDTQMSELR